MGALADAHEAAVARSKLTRAKEAADSAVSDRRAGRLEARAAELR